MTQSQLGCCGLMTEQVEESWQVSPYISGLVFKVLVTVAGLVWLYALLKVWSGLVICTFENTCECCRSGLVWLYALLKVLVTVTCVVWSGPGSTCDCRRSGLVWVYALLKVLVTVAGVAQEPGFKPCSWRLSGSSFLLLFTLSFYF